jgi:hypothetical protein
MGEKINLKGESERISIFTKTHINIRVNKDKNA